MNEAPCVLRFVFLIRDTNKREIKPLPKHCQYGLAKLVVESLNRRHKKTLCRLSKETSVYLNRAHEDSRIPGRPFIWLLTTDPCSYIGSMKTPSSGL